MKRYCLLIGAALVVMLGLGISTTSLCTDMSKTKELILYEGTGVRPPTPLDAIQVLAEKDNIPSDWSFYLDEQSILDATNGVIGPLQDRHQQAGTLRHSIQPVIHQQRAGATLVLIISPDGMTAKLMAAFSLKDEMFCDITTFQYNSSRIWPRYKSMGTVYYLKVLNKGG